MDYKHIESFSNKEVFSLVNPLHEIAIENGCKYKIEKAADGNVDIIYSTRNLVINISNYFVRFSGEYDIRAFLKLYKSSSDYILKELMFNTAIPCEYCINDKCTTFLMAKERTIEFNGEKKKLCGPYRHRVDISVTADNIYQCKSILSMMFEYVYPYMHKDIFYENTVNYANSKKGAFYIVGFRHVNNNLTQSIEDFVKECLKINDDGKRKIDEVLSVTKTFDNGKYFGATTNFANGVLYDFIFGIETKKLPKELPDNMVILKIHEGDWAVYNSTANNYKSIWTHFTERKYYEKEKKGFDSSRAFFEIYDKEGNFSNVHIPVDKELPRDNGKHMLLTHMPDFSIAGYKTYAETDYPLSKDFDFDWNDKYREISPYATYKLGVPIHAIFGKPIQFIGGVVIDDTISVPDYAEIIPIKGGYWNFEHFDHFTGDYYNWTFDMPYKSIKEMNLNHPRAFLEFHYYCRGGYCTTGGPTRIVGKKTFEVVNLDPKVVFGKMEAPPESIVTDNDINDFYNEKSNSVQGSCAIGFTYTFDYPNSPHFDKPIVKGFFPKEGSVLPNDYSRLRLDGGRFVKITEDIFNGEPGWEIEGYMHGKEVEKETGLKVDHSRQAIVIQYDYGKFYEIYVPV